MKRNAFLMTAVLFCLATLATAAEHKRGSAPQAQQAREQSEMTGNYTEVKTPSDVSTTECTPKQEIKSRSKSMQVDPAGDPRASQNEVEYGGAG